MLLVVPDRRTTERHDPRAKAAALGTASSATCGNTPRGLLERHRQERGSAVTFEQILGFVR
jgi:hypothetical protein